MNWERKGNFNSHNNEDVNLVNNKRLPLMYTFSHSVMFIWCILNYARGGLVLSIKDWNF